MLLLGANDLMHSCPHFPFEFKMISSAQNLVSMRSLLRYQSPALAKSLRRSEILQSNNHNRVIELLRVPFYSVVFCTEIGCLQVVIVADIRPDRIVLRHEDSLPINPDRAYPAKSYQSQ